MSLASALRLGCMTFRSAACPCSRTAIYSLILICASDFRNALAAVSEPGRVDEGADSPNSTMSACINLSLQTESLDSGLDRNLSRKNREFVLLINT